MHGFLVEVDTLSQSSGLSRVEIYTEQIAAKDMKTAINELANFLSYRAANSGQDQTATVRVYASTNLEQKASLIRTTTVDIQTGLTVRSGKTAYRDYTSESKRVFQGLLHSD